MTEFLIMSRNLAKETNESEKERYQRHMISERMRREKQRQGYLELHSLLPSGTKRDKNSITLVAAKRVEELQRYKEELERQNSEVEKALAARESEQQVEQAQINVSVGSPSSGVDSMLEVLKCLKQTGSKTRAIQSNFSTQELSAVLWIETKVGAAEVENAVRNTLFEVERKFRFNLLEEYGSGIRGNFFYISIKKKEAEAQPFPEEMEIIVPNTIKYVAFTSPFFMSSRLMCSSIIL